MGFLRRMADRFRRFMYGRYGGTDALNRCLLIVGIVLLLVDSWVGNLYVFIALRVVTLLFLGFSVFRMLSRHIEARYKENQRFLKVWDPIKRFFKRQYLRLRDIKTHRYRTCPHCKATVRLPLKKGKHTCTCPRCHTDFSVKM